MIEITYSLDELYRAAPVFEKASVAVGNFDGIHLGHARVLELAAQRGRQQDGVGVALTFDPHPRAVVGGAAPPRLTSRERRRKLLQALGMHATVTLRFDREVAALRPEQFAKNVLADGLHARHVVVGDDFRFGYRAGGTTETLTELGGEYGFSVQTVPAVKVGDVVVSSSAIREALQRGDVAEATRLLGREYAIDGTVVRGDGRGASLGFPTANVDVSKQFLLPAFGVYVAQALDRPALAVVGDKPTFGGSEPVLEVHVLDFEGDLYGQSMDVSFLRRLRDIKAFADGAALVTQMAEDVEQARAYFRSKGKPEVVG